MIFRFRKMTLLGKVAVSHFALSSAALASNMCFGIESRALEILLGVLIFPLGYFFPGAWAHIRAYGAYPPENVITVAVLLVPNSYLWAFLITFLIRRTRGRPRAT